LVNIFVSMLIIRIFDILKCLKFSLKYNTVLYRRLNWIRRLEYKIWNLRLPLDRLD